MNEIIIPPEVSLIRASDAPLLLQSIRPSWQAKDLITRVRRLIDVDPSSACQRLFNAAIHDLREKVVIAGIDIAREAAKQHKLPPVDRAEDIEDYSTSKLIDLAHRIGLLTRPDWRRLSRCYEIRRDLEHEYDEYEAGVEDCVYIFQTCIQAVLSRDPIHLLRVADVKDLVEQPQAAVPSPSLIEDYQHAPAPRQEEILKFLASIAMDSTKAELVRQNSFVFLSSIAELTQNPVKLVLAEHLQQKITRSGPSRLVIRVSFASGVLPYLKQAHLHDFYSAVLAQMRETGHQWRAYPLHGELLRSFKEVGGLVYCPQDPRREILKYLCLTYIGESGGMTSYGNVRNVFYSNTAEPIITELIEEAASQVADDLRNLVDDKEIKRLITNQHLARRYEALLDIVSETNGG
ncbi:hypothetical protein [Puniceicoccus vermicola]|uniref:Uncharacterized protein n=1 Tax=Puniceicoccus vermicola TaxID=388746 RepID=A0A7X1B061_9BACT|nr:hypothetical protein [Puniceicoccus vermicola]MBC2603149.1 hypothetical protein [Puniceicoccus vermicola]